MKPRVLHLIDSFHQGGTERQAVQLTTLLHGTGRYTLHVACLNDSGVLRPEIDRLALGPISAFPMVSFRHPRTARQLVRFGRLLRALEIDVIHAHDFYTNIFGMAAATLAGVRARIASHRETGMGRTAAQRWVERRAFSAAHAVVVNADAIGADLVAHGVPAGKIHTIYNGIDPSRVQTTSSATRDDRLALLGIPRGAHRQFVTILANLWLALKDHPTFLRAARQVREAVPDTGFIVAGEGALREPLQRLVAELGIADCVYFTGRCQRVADLLAISDVCVLSSISEGFPNVVVEYMAAGVRSWPPTSAARRRPSATVKPDSWCRRATWTRWRDASSGCFGIPTHEPRWAAAGGRSRSGSSPVRRNSRRRKLSTIACSAIGRSVATVSPAHVRRVAENQTSYLKIAIAPEPFPELLDRPE
jgi:glycosyltransferase involved in cell wall biosynthesis